MKIVPFFIQTLVSNSWRSCVQSNLFVQDDRLVVRLNRSDYQFIVLSDNLINISTQHETTQQVYPAGLNTYQEIHVIAIVMSESLSFAP